jgi:hypothetical protein
MESLSYRLYPDQNLLLVEAKGVVSMGDIFALLNALLEDPNYRIGMDCFWDATQVTGAQGNIEEYHQAAELVSNDEVFSQASRTAIIIKAGNTEILQYAQGFLLMSSASKIDHRVFTDEQLNDALHFLAISSLPEQ